MSRYVVGPCPLPGCGRMHGVQAGPRPRSGDRNLSGAGVDRQTESTDSQPVERQRPPTDATG